MPTHCKPSPPPEPASQSIFLRTKTQDRPSSQSSFSPEQALGSRKQPACGRRNLNPVPKSTPQQELCPGIFNEFSVSATHPSCKSILSTYQKSIATSLKTILVPLAHRILNHRSPLGAGYSSHVLEASTIIERWEREGHMVFYAAFAFPL